VRETKSVILITCRKT